MRAHRLFLAAAAALCGACGGPTPGVAVPVPVAPPCEPRQLGQLISEGTNVDASYTHVYWMDYNFGRLQRRSRAGGAIEDLASWPEEHRTEGMRLAGDHLYWTSKAEGALFRIAVAGGEPERLIAIDDMPNDVEVAGTVVYVAGYEDRVTWWRVDGTSGTLRVDGAQVPLATRGEVLYIGTEDAILRVTDPTGGPTEVTRTGGAVDALAVTATTVYWTEKAADRMRLKRRSLDGATAEVAITELGLYDHVLLEAVDDGIYLSNSNLVYFMADDRAELVPVARAATEIGGLRVSASSVFVGTTMGSVEELCPVRDRPLELTAIDPDAEGVEWYASGDLQSRRTIDGATDTQERFYADGSPLSVVIFSAGEILEMRHYLVDGTLVD